VSVVGGLFLPLIATFSSQKVTHTLFSVHVQDMAIS